MKNLLNYLIGLSACGGGGGGDSAPAAAPGGIVGASSASGYVGIGTWSGYLTIVNMQAYQQYLYTNGLCQGYQCNQVSGLVQLKISTVNGQQCGSLPDRVQFVFSPASGIPSWNTADGFINAQNNGMLLNYNGYNGSTFGGGNFGGGNCVPGYPCQQPGTQVGQPAGTPMLQINTQYTDATHNLMNVQVTANGAQIATGQVQRGGLAAELHFVVDQIDRGERESRDVDSAGRDCQQRDHEHQASVLQQPAPSSKLRRTSTRV